MRGNADYFFICEKFVKWYSFYYIVKQGLKEGLSSWWEHTKEILKSQGITCN